MAFVKELIVCVVFVAVVVKSFPRMYEENAVEENNGGGQTADIDRNEHSHDHAYSYHHFVEPVAGHHEEITWQDKHHHHIITRYKYSYGVDDHHTKDHHGQKEHRDDKHIQGKYHIHEPGGNVRSVKYYADPHGEFYAEVYNYGGNEHLGGTYGHKHR
ncbi:PREDICTED: histidine-rich glycoprotein-like [Trachymyrmex septentrionalis]|uniref:histidine-rich glycoprotein-like n=1 Tax=Trachymyrmex septentrionalis TaxID=34720 RepID=UPI00084F1CD7|nr:PREDICTED: histidine-rich glycoprotein-like [Trachymyrmex septentrionalis]